MSVAQPIPRLTRQLLGAGGAVSRGVLLGAWAALLCAAAVSCTDTAHAQDSQRVQQATRLFDAARENVARGDLGQACRQFDASERLDPQLGTKMHLADCYERQGKLASAWLHFRAAEMLAAERIAGGAVEPREKVARLRAARLESRLPRLRLIIATPQPELVVKLDGHTIPSRSWGTTAPIDPGEHLLHVSAPGHNAWQRSFTIAEQQHQELKVPALIPAIDLGPPPPAKTAPQPKPVDTASAAPALTTLRIVAYTLAGAGLIAAGTGIAFGLATQAKLSKRDALCPDDVCRDRAQIEQVDRLTLDARGTATTANALMIGGGVALAAGVSWVLLGPTSSEAQLSLLPSLSPYAAGVTLHGRGL